MTTDFPVDDASIGDDELLYLRVFPMSACLVRTEFGFRPQSGALRSKEPLSVDLGSLCTAEETRDRAAFQPFHVAAFSAGQVRAVGGWVVRDPMSDNAAHAHVYGTNKNMDGSLSQKQCEQIARKARVVIVNPLAPTPEG